MDLAKLNKDKKRRPAVGVDAMVYGKIPPQDTTSEKAVLGAILLERHALAEVQDLLTPEKFYLETHQHIYRAILSLDSRSQGIDVITVVMELRRMDVLEIVGGASVITELTKEVVSSANIGDHTKIVIETWMARELIKAGGEMIHDGYDDSSDAFDILDRAEAAIGRIMNSNDRGKVTGIAEATARSLQRIAVLRAQDSSLTGIPSEFEQLDTLTHGWQDTDLIILAARPSVGKTAFALNLAWNAAANRVKPTTVVFFSLEMSEPQLMERLISRQSGIFLDRIKTGRLSEEEVKTIHMAAAKIADAPIFLDDTPALNIFELRAKCRRLKNKHNLGFIVIDYLQLMSGCGDKGNREQEISKISRDLKSLAKELQVPVIALSQLSRAVESRTEKTPQLSDLRESGAIEQDADMVMFLYRPEYYGITANEMGESNKGETHVKIAKHRNGSLDTVKLTALLHIQKFVEFEGQPFQPPSPSSSWRPIKTPYKDNLDF